MYWEANIAFFITANWLELVFISITLKSIVNIRDELNISKEVLFINIFWGVLSTIYIGITSFSVFFKEEKSLSG